MSWQYGENAPLHVNVCKYGVAKIQFGGDGTASPYRYPLKKKKLNGTKKDDKQHVVGRLSEESDCG